MKEIASAEKFENQSESPPYSVCMYVCMCVCCNRGRYELHVSIVP